MAEINSFNIRDASLDDGTLDFYTLIQEPHDADGETLRAKIQQIYAEAQANRDHRNLNKRREYQTLLDWLPRARATLLESDKRVRYNEYLTSARAGSADVDFETFMTGLLDQGENFDEKTGLLGVQDRPQEPRARVIKTPIDPVTPKVPQKAAVPRASSSSPLPAAIGGGVGGFIIGAAVGYFVGHLVLPAIVLGAVVAAIIFVILNRQPSSGIRS